MNTKFGYLGTSLILILLLITGMSFSSSCDTAMTTFELMKVVEPYPVQIIISSSNLDKSNPASDKLIGNAFFINSDGFLITADHILKAGQVYLEQINAQIKELSVVVPPHNNSQKSSPVSFDIAFRDELTDIAVLKLKTRLGSNSVKHTLVHLIPNEGGGGFGLSNIIKNPLKISDDSVRFNSAVKGGEAIGTSGYPSLDSNLVSYQGKITGHINLTNVNFSNTPDNFTWPKINVDSADFPTDKTDSGQMVYFLKDGVCAGITVNIIQADGKPVIGIVRSESISRLIEENTIDWIKVD
jgi:hypothetical protein